MNDSDTAGPTTPPLEPPVPRPPAPEVPPAEPPAPPVGYYAAPTPGVAPSPDAGPLPVCDYTADAEEPCEEPATVKRWSGAAVVVSAVLGALAGGALVAAAMLWLFGAFPGLSPLSADGAGETPKAPGTIEIKTSDVADRAVAVSAKVTPVVVSVGVEQAVINPITGETGLRQAGNGSGVVIREDGYVLTNFHVIDGADRIFVVIGTENVEAEVVGTDSQTDLAVVKVDRTGLAVADLGESEDLEVGQFVAAVGSPFGLDKTVTTGIISALQRTSDVEGAARYTNLIQTDAAINPGNSGGALADENGKVIGINTLIQSPSGQYGAAQSAGIGFAIPIDFARDVATQLIEKGRAEHPYMGVQTQSVDGASAEQLGLTVDSGALIMLVVPGSPAERAGLQRGDVIVRVGNRDVSSSQDVFGEIREHKIGEEIELIVVRQDTRRTIKVTLGSDSASR